MEFASGFAKYKMGFGEGKRHSYVPRNAGVNSGSFGTIETFATAAFDILGFCFSKQRSKSHGSLRGGVNSLAILSLFHTANAGTPLP